MYIYIYIERERYVIAIYKSPRTKAWIEPSCSSSAPSTCIHSATPGLRPQRTVTIYNGSQCTMNKYNGAVKKQ